MKGQGAETLGNREPFQGQPQRDPTVALQWILCYSPRVLTTVLRENRGLLGISDPPLGSSWKRSCSEWRVLGVGWLGLHGHPKVREGGSRGRPGYGKGLSLGLRSGQVSDGCQRCLQSNHPRSLSLAGSCFGITFNHSFF